MCPQKWTILTTSINASLSQVIHTCMLVEGAHPTQEAQNRMMEHTKIGWQTIYFAMKVNEKGFCYFIKITNLTRNGISALNWIWTQNLAWNRKTPSQPTDHKIDLKNLSITKATDLNSLGNDMQPLTSDAWGYSIDSDRTLTCNISQAPDVTHLSSFSRPFQNTVTQQMTQFIYLYTEN